MKIEMKRKMRKMKLEKILVFCLFVCLFVCFVLFVLFCWLVVWLVCGLRGVSMSTDLNVNDLDRQISLLYNCEIIQESEVKVLCDKAREILLEEDRKSTRLN